MCPSCIFHEQFHSPSHFQSRLNPMALVSLKRSQGSCCHAVLYQGEPRNDLLVVSDQHYSSLSFQIHIAGNTFSWLCLPNVNSMPSNRRHEALQRVPGTTLMNVNRRRGEGLVFLGLQRVQYLWGCENRSWSTGAWSGNLSESTSVCVKWCLSQLPQLVGNKVLEW